MTQSSSSKKPTRPLQTMAMRAPWEMAAPMTSVENGGLVNRVELYRKTLGWSDTIYTWWQRCSSHQAQHVHLSAAPLQTQPWAHLEQPTGQQEQQLFLQEVHLQFLQAQELVQVQEPPVEQEQLGSIPRSGEAGATE